VSQVGAIEYGLRVLSELPELEESSLLMTRAIVSDRPEDPSGRPQLASSLIALVEGEIARFGTLRTLLQIEPSLWSTCGRPEAALSSFIASLPKMDGEPQSRTQQKQPSTKAELLSP
jgi:hypothetical protein